MDEYKYVQCLFCNTGREETVVSAVHDRAWGRAIFPKRVKTIRQGREWVESDVPLLPGYVFLYSEDAPIRHDALLSLQNVIRVLGYGSAMQDTLVAQDLQFADWLWRLNGRVGVMKALQIGDRIEIIDGIFKRLQGTVVQMDRRRRTARVQLSTEGAVRNIWLAYEIIDKLEV